MNYGDRLCYHSSISLFEHLTGEVSVTVPIVTHNRKNNDFAEPLMRIRGLLLLLFVNVRTDYFISIPQKSESSIYRASL